MNKLCFAKQDISSEIGSCVRSMFAANGGGTNADEKGKLVSHLRPDPNSFLMKTLPISETAVSAFRTLVEATIRSNGLWVELDPSTNVNMSYGALNNLSSGISLSEVDNIVI